MIDRRSFIGAMVGTAVATPLSLRAQPTPRVARIAMLTPYSAQTTARWYDAFRQNLRALGWTEGKDVEFLYRYAEGHLDRLPSLADEIAHLNVNVIVTSVTDDTAAAKAATRTIPIVMASVGDPVARGFVASLAHPGGNVTGLAQLSPELSGKRLQLLQEIVPNVSLVGVLRDPQNPASTQSWFETQESARKLGVGLLSLEFRSADDFAGAFQSARTAHAGALVLLPDRLVVNDARRLAELAAKGNLPVMAGLREYVDAGGLIAYGPDRADLYRRAAGYVDKILKGAKPGDLPVERPTKFELVVNLKTAKALSVTIPAPLLLRADEVIQ